MDGMKLYQTIGEVSMELGLTESNIRYWCDVLEKEGALKVHRSHAHGYREFTVEDVEKLRLAQYYIRIDKYTIKGAALRLKKG